MLCAILVDDNKIIYADLDTININVSIFKNSEKIINTNCYCSTQTSQESANMKEVEVTFYDKDGDEREITLFVPIVDNYFYDKNIEDYINDIVDSVFDVPVVSIVMYDTCTDIGDCLSVVNQDYLINESINRNKIWCNENKEEFDKYYEDYFKNEFIQYNEETIDIQRLQEKIIQNEYMSEIEELIELYNEN